MIIHTYVTHGMLRVLIELFYVPRAYSSDTFSDAFSLSYHIPRSEEAPFPATMFPLHIAR